VPLDAIGREIVNFISIGCKNLTKMGIINIFYYFIYYIVFSCFVKNIFYLLRELQFLVVLFVSYSLMTTPI